MQKLKILIFSTLLTSIIFIWARFYVLANENVNVFAVVWWWNTPPSITQTIPSFDPIVIKKDSIQNFSLVLKDTDSTTINYTITPNYWANFPTSWNFTDWANLSAGTARLNFTYFAPSTKQTNETITITIDDNDGNIITKIINLYVY